MAEIKPTELYKQVMLDNIKSQQWNQLDQDIYFLFTNTSSNDQVEQQLMYESSKSGKIDIQKQKANLGILVKLLSLYEIKNDIQIYGQIRMDNVQAVKVYPTQTYMPIIDSQNNKISMYYKTQRQLSGLIGFNSTHETLKEVLRYNSNSQTVTKSELIQKFQGTEFNNSDDTVYIPYIIIMFFNPVKFGHMSVQQIKNQILKFEEVQYTVDPLPQQTTYKFIAEKIIYKDFTYEQQQQYNPILVQLEGK